MVQRPESSEEPHTTSAGRGPVERNGVLTSGRVAAPLNQAVGKIGAAGKESIFRGRGPLNSSRLTCLGSFIPAEQAEGFFTIQLQIIILILSKELLWKGNGMFKRAGAVAAWVLLLTSLGLGQDQGRFDASINGGAVFTKAVTGNGVQQSATVGPDYFASFRFRFKAKHSLIFNYGRTKNSQIYQTNFDYHVLTSTTEYSGAYRYTLFEKGKLAPFVLIGAGALAFWVDQAGFGSATIQATRLSWEGKVVCPQFPVSSLPSDKARLSAGIVSTGLAAVAFEDDRTGNNGIYIQNVNPDCSLGQR